MNKNDIRKTLAKHPEAVFRRRSTLYVFNPLDVDIAILHQHKDVKGRIVMNDGTLSEFMRAVPVRGVEIYALSTAEHQAKRAAAEQEAKEREEAYARRRDAEAMQNIILKDRGDDIVRGLARLLNIKPEDIAPRYDGNIIIKIPASVALHIVEEAMVS